jgi:hypothetical protein
MRSRGTTWPGMVSERYPGPGRTTGTIVPVHLLESVRRSIDNYHKLKQHLEKISDINRELLRRKRKKSKT